MPIINGESRTSVGTLTLNQEQLSDLSVVGEGDLWEINLVAGRTYTLTLDRDPSGASGALADPTLYLYDSAGNFLAYNDDSGTGRNSSLRFEATATGTYYIDARAFNDSYAGDYKLLVVADNSAPELTGALTSLPAQLGNGGTFTLTQAQLLGGYTDPDGDVLDVDGNPTVGGLALVSSTATSWTYRLPTIPSAGTSQTLAIDYRVSDGRGGSVDAAQSLLINSPSAPNAINMVAVGDSYTSEGGGTVSYVISLTNAITSGSLTVVLETLDATEGRFLVNGNLANTQTLTFNSGASSHTIVVKGIQDYETDGSAPYRIRAQARDGSTPANNAKGSWTSAIRNFNGGTATSYRNVDLYNDGDTANISLPNPDTGVWEQQDVDRDVPVYLVGDDNRPREDNLRGLDGADRLYGGYMIDTLWGGIGNDRLYGGYEDDQLYGEAGNDQLYGEQDDDYLSGGAGADRLDGGIGADRLVGGADSDTYYVTLDDFGNIEDIIEEVAADVGTDTVYVPFQVEAYVAPDGIEVIRMNAGFGESSVTGNSGDNTIVGNAGDNTVNGGTGNDACQGGAGDDTLNGGTGNDTLTGGVGGDVLVGGVGRDLLTGGVGNDRFVFNTYTELGQTRSTADHIQDFGTGDRIDLAALDANLVTTATNEAFTFLTTSTFTDLNGSGTVSGFSQAGGQLFYNAGYLYIDNDADTNAEYVIQVTLAGDKSSITAGDFVL